MIIGLDFDNTIVKYDSVFHSVACEKGFIDKSVAINKVAVRDAMRDKGMNDVWTEMQGYVYGCRMNDAEIFEGATEFMRSMQDQGHRCVIISHKTRLPYAGPPYDMQAAAKAWIEKSLAGLIKPEGISFHETKVEKINHIGTMKCDVFLDDLPEILTAENFPKNTRGILFDPEAHHKDYPVRVHNWNEIAVLL